MNLDTQLGFIEVRLVERAFCFLKRDFFQKFQILWFVAKEKSVCTISTIVGIVKRKLCCSMISTRWSASRSFCFTKANNGAIIFGSLRSLYKKNERYLLPGKEASCHPKNPIVSRVPSSIYCPCHSLRSEHWHLPIDLSERSELYIKEFLLVWITELTA